MVKALNKKREKIFKRKDKIFQLKISSIAFVDDHPRTVFALIEYTCKQYFLK